MWLRWTWLLLFLSFGYVRSFGVPDDVVVHDVEREIDLRQSFVEVITNIRFSVHGTTPLNQFVICSKKRTASHEVYFKGLLGEEGEELGVEIIKAKFDDDIPQIVTCKGLKFRQALRSDQGEFRLRLQAVYIDIMQASPKEATQHHEQRMTYRDNVYVILPYTVKLQKTTVVTPNGEVFSRTIAKPSTQRAKNVVYGPYADVPPFEIEMLFLHFTHNAPFTTAVKAVKEVQVSLWGNIYVEEIYEIENTGAKLKGTWSRLDYTSGRFPLESVIREFVAEIPRNADGLYFSDEIGNISTSKISPTSNSLLTALKPRYPLFGGWKTKFKFGYSVPLYGVLLQKEIDRHLLRFSYFPSISRIVIQDYELRVVLPDGSYDVSHDIPFEMKQYFDSKHWYFDYVARPVLVLKKRQVVPHYDRTVQLEYRPTFLAVYRKILLFITAVFCGFVSIIIALRMDFEIVGIREENREKIQTVLFRMKQLLKDYQDLIEEMRSTIAAMRNNHAVNKTSQTKNRIESKLKEIDGHLEAGMETLRAAGYRKLKDMAELTNNAKDLQNHCFQLYNKLVALVQAKTSKKEIEQKVQIEEKMVSYLADGVQETLSYLFS